MKGALPIIGIGLILWVLAHTFISLAGDPPMLILAAVFLSPLFIVGAMYLYRDRIYRLSMWRKMKLNLQQTVLFLVAAGFLFYGSTGEPNIGFYTLLRFVVFAVTGYYAFLCYKANNSSLWPWLFGFIAVLFNPLVPVHFDGDIWKNIDLYTGVFLLFAIVLLRIPALAQKKRID